MRGLSPALVLTIAIVFGAAMDATIKHLTQTNPVLLVVFGRYLLGAVFSAGAYLRAGAPPIRLAVWRAHMVRGMFIAATASAFFWSLTVLPLAEAVALSFVYPLIVPFVAAVMIGERVRPTSLIAAGAGFVGVIIAAQGAPSAAEAPQHGLGVAAVLISALFFAVAMVLLRQRAQADGPIIVSLMSSVIPGVLVAAPAIALSAPPNWADWPAFLLMGALAALFMYLLARAYAGAACADPLHRTGLGEPLGLCAVSRNAARRDLRRRSAHHRGVPVRGL